MATKRYLIDKALEEIGMADYEFDASPEELASALERLDDVAAEWDGQTIRTGYNFAAGIDDDAGIPDTIRRCFYLHLGLSWARSFGKTVTPEQKIEASNSYNTMLTQLRRTPQMPRPARLPRGTGTKLGVIEQQYFAPTGEVEGLNDGATEY